MSDDERSLLDVTDDALGVWQEVMDAERERIETVQAILLGDTDPAPGLPHLPQSRNRR